MKLTNILLTLFLLFSTATIFMPTQTYAISLDDDEEDMEDVEDYMQKAKKSANSSNFSKAKEYLKKAKRLGVLHDDVKDTESYVKKSERNYEARLERKRQARAEEKRKKEKARKQAELEKNAKALMDRLNRNSTQSYSSSSTSSVSSNDVAFVSVSAEFTRGILNSSLARNLQMSPSNPSAAIGSFENGNYSKTASHGAIHKGINGIAGYYNYSFQSDSGKIGCSGRIHVSGKKRTLRLNVDGSCNNRGSGEF